MALPRGGTHPNRTTRIFVARIPPTVQDAQFRSYFEQFGRVQDAYMPKDAFKQAHRGIGFVTYATAEPVEQVGLPVGMLAEEDPLSKGHRVPLHGHIGVLGLSSNPLPSL